VIASVTQALEAIAARARELGLTVTVQPERFDALATDLGVRFAQRLAHCATDVWVAGGESLVRLPQAPGRGGRNQHLALAAAVALTGQPDLLLLAAGTDGTDGPTADAGALVDAGTCERIAVGGLNPQDALARADAGSALEASGDLLHTGPTGTNVGDLVIGLRMPLARAAQFARHERAFRAADA
jgi:glycerate 2-kinase